MGSVRAAIAGVGRVLKKHLKELLKMSPEEVRQDRYDRFRKLGATVERVVHIDEMSGTNDG